MKIEKLNENQLKITLAPEDLSIRGLALNELSYGSPKTKELYNELVDQALNEFGFENEDGALVIEAIPTSKGNLVIFITKNQTADDLDTRFSRFSPDILGEEEGDNEFIPLTDMLKFSGQSEKKAKAIEKALIEKMPLKDGNAKIFVFNTLDAVTELCIHIKDIFNGKSSLFKSNQSKLYFLILEKSLSDKETFGKICNIASEFSTQGRSNYATTSVINEHCEKIIGSDAVTILAAIN